MKRIVAIALLLVLLLTGCKVADVLENQAQQAENSGLSLVKIGVATYDINDAQVRMFKEYLDHYIKGCFPDVTFLYSESIENPQEMMDFLGDCADHGVQGILSFNSYDLQAEVEFCSEKEMYLIRPSSTSADDVFAAVADNPYFVGEIGPGAKAEYEEAAKLARAMSEGSEEAGFIILSGGAGMGNEMHRLRTLAFLETLQEVHGVRLPGNCQSLAATGNIKRVETEGLKIMIIPGYVPDQDATVEAILSGEYAHLLSTLPVTGFMETLNRSSVTCGVTDCFSEDNYFGFKKGKIAYVAGKYQSEIGPAFAALYNAIAGDGELFRESGKAFRLEQGFWTAASSEEFDSRYALARGEVINAYDYQDLYGVIKSLDPTANFFAFKRLVSQWQYEDCLARRSK